MLSFLRNARKKKKQQALIISNRHSSFKKKVTTKWIWKTKKQDAEKTLNLPQIIKESLERKVAKNGAFDKITWEAKRDFNKKQQKQKKTWKESLCEEKTNKWSNHTQTKLATIFCFCFKSCQGNFPKKTKKVFFFDVLRILLLFFFFSCYCFVLPKILPLFFFNVWLFCFVTQCCLNFFFLPNFPFLLSINKKKLLHLFVFSSHKDSFQVFICFCCILLKSLFASQVILSKAPFSATLLSSTYTFVSKHCVSDDLKKKSC